MRLFTLLLFLCIVISDTAAQRGENSLAAREAYDLGAEAMMEKKFAKAVRFFRNATRYDTSYLEAYRMLGAAEALQKEYISALDAYNKIIQADSTFSRLLYYEIGQVYYKLNRPELALHYFRKFQDLQSRPFGDFGIRGERELADERNALAGIDANIRAARIILDSTEFINITEIYNLGSPINSELSDLFPFFANNQRSLLFTRRNEKREDDDLIFARRRNVSENWTTTKVGSFNTNKPEGMITLARDGERVFFTLCRGEESSQGGCDIFSGLLVDGKVQAVEPLDDYVNSASWESQAGVSCDGRKLFFASTRPGGVGGSDIWYCELQDDGHWTQPVNVGVPVNSAGDEEAPFLSNDGQTLFFSSNGHPGLGDQDIYMSWWDDQRDRWTNAINLGPPVNSPHRELGFHLSADNKTGYFASDRPGGLGGLDIYGFTLSERLTGEPITYVSGFVLDSITGEPLPGVKVPLNGGGTYETNYAGRFFICAGADEVLELSTTPEGYLPYRNSFAIPSWDNLSPYRIDLLVQQADAPMVAKAPPAPRPDTIRRLARLVIRNHSVLFNFDDAALIPRQKENLELFVRNLTEGRIVEVSITGYADNIGEDNYNMQLSEERARAVGAFLREAGITTDQVSIKGLGSLSEGPRELNRRVEISVKVLQE